MLTMPEGPPGRRRSFAMVLPVTYLDHVVWHGGREIGGLSGQDELRRREQRRECFGEDLLPAWMEVLLRLIDQDDPILGGAQGDLPEEQQKGSFAIAQGSEWEDGALSILESEMKAL